MSPSRSPRAPTWSCCSRTPPLRARCGPPLASHHASTTKARSSCSSATTTLFRRDRAADRDVEVERRRLRARLRIRLARRERGLQRRLLARIERTVDDGDLGRALAGDLGDLSALHHLVG